MIITIKNLNPIAIDLGILQIRWYSLAYIVGILFVMLFLKKENKKNPIMSEIAYENWLNWAVLSVIIGGRIGYILFYNFSYYINNFWQIFAVWKGGMSFHGGLLGSIFGMYLFTKKYKIDFLKLMDLISIAAPIGLFFGRLANFINLELYGRPTNSNFGFIFSQLDDLPRHPSQIYEALMEGALLFIILFSLHRFTNISNKKGFLSGFFLIGYAISRAIAENFRQPDPQIGFLFLGITMGQILSFFLIFPAIYLIFFNKNNSK